MTSDPSRPRDDVGSVGEEAAKLLGALAGWAREHAPEVASANTPSGLHDLMDEEVAHTTMHGSGSCSWCPLCRAMDWVRHVNPEAREHLRDAGLSIAQAAAALLAHSTGGASAEDVERLTLDDDAWPDDLPPDHAST